MTTALRKATRADLGMIFEAEHAYMLAVEPASEPQWLRVPEGSIALWRANLDRCTIMEVGGTTAGYVMWTYECFRATLITINVLPLYRRRGLGLKLLEIFVDQSLTQQCTVLNLSVHRDNPARALYPRGGFELVGEEGDWLFFRRLVSRPNG